MKVKYEGNKPPFFVIGVKGIWKKGIEREVSDKEWEKIKNIPGMKKVIKKVKEDK